MKNYMQLWKYTTRGIELVTQGSKTEIIDFIKAEFPMYNIGYRTPLYKLSEIIQSKYQLYSNGKRIYP